MKSDLSGKLCAAKSSPQSSESHTVDSADCGSVTYAEHESIPLC